MLYLVFVLLRQLNSMTLNLAKGLHSGWPQRFACSICNLIVVKLINMYFNGPLCIPKLVISMLVIQMFISGVVLLLLMSVVFMLGT